MKLAITIGLIVTYLSVPEIWSFAICNIVAIITVRFIAVRIRRHCASRNPARIQNNEKQMQIWNVKKQTMSTSEKRADCEIN